ncbi:hypothetical protein ACOMHN_027968 [Nucella lapillus]
MSMNVGEIPVGTVEPVKSALAVTPVGAELALLDHTVKQTEEVLFSDVDECRRNPCENRGTCDNSHGSYSCLCRTGFTGGHCETDIDECENQPCSNNGTCQNSPGTYTCQCTHGFTGRHCKTELQSFFGIVAAVVVPVVILLIISAVLGTAFLHRRRRRSRRQNADEQNVDLPLEQRLDYDGAQDGGNECQNVYQNIPIDPARCGVHFVPEADGNTTKTKMQGPSPRAPNTAGPSPSSSRKQDKPLEEADEEESWEEEFSHEDLYASYSFEPGRWQLDVFQIRLLDALAALDGLSQQFKSLLRGMLFDWKCGSSPENLAKNRFKQLGAYDKNRVVLARAKGDNNTNYINASYIKGVHRDREYIAMQGPLEQTKSDTWLMVWQENISQIVMLTNLLESGKIKCCKYWPDVGQTARASRLDVTCLGEDVRADFILRSFSLKLRGTSDTRSVQQYHYVSWPDHGVPTAESLLDYWRFVTARASLTAPLLVHCSAGVGRTGTYIALDLAFNRKSRGLEVNVLDIVKELREQRTLMIQTEAQYKFLHEVVLEAHSSQNTRLSVPQLDLNFSGDLRVWKSDNALTREYQMLQQMKSWAKRNTSTAEMPENRHKNRDVNDLPDDRHLVYLTDYAKGRNQYINAVFKSSLTNKQGLLLTQLPLKDTIVDFWRLVYGSQVHTIVSLGSLDKNQTGQDCVHYWPVKKGRSVTAGDYTLSLSHTTPLGHGITTYTLAFKSKGESRTVQLLHYAGWCVDEPGAIPDVTHLVNVVKTNADSDSSPVVIQCLDGASKSGLFCVLYDVICRMTVDEDIDIFSAVRSVQQIRPAAITKEQYPYCYQVAQQFKQSMTVYENV